METGMKPKKVCAKVGISTLALFAVWTILANAGVLLIARFYPSGLSSIWLLLLNNDIALYVIGLPIFLLLMSKIPDGADPERQRLKMTPLRFIKIFVFCLGMAYIFNFINSYLTGLIEARVPDFDPAENMAILLGENSVLSRLIFIVLIPAVGEEFIFRHCLHKKLRGASDKTYIIISGLCFGFFHASYSQVMFAVAIGMILAWVYCQTRNLFYCSAIHFLINFISGVFLPFILEKMNIDLNMLSEVSESGDASALAEDMLSGGGSLLVVIVGFAVIAVMAVAIILLVANYRNIIMSLRPPAEPGWPYKPPKRHYTNRKARLMSSRVRNPYGGQGGEEWTMPAPEDEIVPRESPFPDYSKAIEVYREHQETALKEKEYNYLSGVPYGGPKDETLENLPISGWFKTCMLNYGMIAYFSVIILYMLSQIVLLLI